MVSSEIFKTYRKMKSLEISKDEAKLIFYDNIGCVEKYLKCYSYLNFALDAVKEKGFSKETLREKINQEIKLEKRKRENNNSFFEKLIQLSQGLADDPAFLFSLKIHYLKINVSEFKKPAYGHHMDDAYDFFGCDSFWTYDMIQA